MSRIPSTFPKTTSTTQTSSSSKNSKNSVPDAVNDLDLSTFLNLMITELQNQDPLNPLDNKDMLAQISQLRQVGSTDKLTQTLELGAARPEHLQCHEFDRHRRVRDFGRRRKHRVAWCNRVAIDDGEPKIHMDKESTGAARGGEGDVKKGKYSYRVVWAGRQR